MIDCIQCVFKFEKRLIVQITIVWTGNKMFEMKRFEMKCIVIENDQRGEDSSL